MAQMPPLIITQSLPLCTQLPFSLCSLALADTRGPSERISAVLLAEFRHGYINKMPVPPASANHYPDTLCTDYSYRQWGMNINYSLSLRHQTSRMWSENMALLLATRRILCDKKKKIFNYFAKSTLYAARRRFNGRGATLEGPSKTTLATCSALPFKNLGKLMSFHWHPHNKAAWAFAGKLYSSVVPNQPVAADFISLVTGLQRELKTLPAASLRECFSSSEIAISSFLIKDLSIIAQLSKCN